MTDWKRDLQGLLKDKRHQGQIEEKQVEQAKSQIPGFLDNVVMPAFQALKEELEKNGKQVAIYKGPEFGTIRVGEGSHTPYQFSVMVRVNAKGAFLHTQIPCRDKSDGKRYLAEGSIKSGTDDTIGNITKDDVIVAFLRDYRAYTR